MNARWRWLGLHWFLGMAFATVGRCLAIDTADPVLLELETFARGPESGSRSEAAARLRLAQELPGLWLAVGDSERASAWLNSPPGQAAPDARWFSVTRTLLAAGRDTEALQQLTNFPPRFRASAAQLLMEPIRSRVASGDLASARKLLDSTLQWLGPAEAGLQAQFRLLHAGALVRGRRTNEARASLGALEAWLERNATSLDPQIQSGVRQGLMPLLLQAGLPDRALTNALAIDSPGDRLNALETLIAEHTSRNDIDSALRLSRWVQDRYAADIVQSRIIPTMPVRPVTALARLGRTNEAMEVLEDFMKALRAQATDSGASNWVATVAPGVQSMVIQRILVEARGSWRDGTFDDRALDWAGQLSRRSQARVPRDFIAEAQAEKRALESIRRGKLPEVQAVDVEGEASGASAESLAAVMMVSGHTNEAMTLLNRLPAARRTAGLEMAAQTAVSLGLHEIARDIVLQVPKPTDPAVRADLVVQHGIEASRGLLASGKTNAARDLAIAMVSRGLSNLQQAPAQSRPLEQAVLLLAEMGEAKLCAQTLTSAGAAAMDSAGPAVGRRLTRALGPTAATSLVRQLEPAEPRPWLLLGVLQERLGPGTEDLLWGR